MLSKSQSRWMLLHVETSIQVPTRKNSLIFCPTSILFPCNTQQWPCRLREGEKRQSWKCKLSSQHALALIALFWFLSSFFCCCRSSGSCYFPPSIPLSPDSVRLYRKHHLICIGKKKKTPVQCAHLEGPNWFIQCNYAVLDSLANDKPGPRAAN